MRLIAYAQAVGPDVVQLWVGQLDTEQPQAPTFRIDHAPAVPLAPQQVMAPIRDRRVGAGGQPCNHHAVFRFAVPGPSREVLVEVLAGGERNEFTTWTLATEVPSALQGSFNLLLTSCYFQPEDKGGLLGTIISQIKLAPHLTVMAGDQVYLDLPLLEDLPEDEPALSRTLGEKYLRNWGSAQLQVPGLETVLTRAPVVMIPDDHEFWNNYPFRQKQLPTTWKAEVRQRWAAAAQALYEDYQLACDPHAAGATRLDVEPLRMLFVDMRCRRDSDFNQLMNPVATAALKTWADDLLKDRADAKPRIGVLSSGQALFIVPPSEESKKIDVDAEMGNFTQFDLVREQLERLADAGVPVLYITGDVHWNRVGSASDRHFDDAKPMFYEVISSPSRLIRVPLLDTAKEAANSLKGVFGSSDPWPRHSEPDPVPATFGKNARFALKSHFGRRGDHVAMVSFTRAGGGVDFEVKYYGIHSDKAVAQSVSGGKYELRPR